MGASDARIERVVRRLTYEREVSNLTSAASSPIAEVTPAAAGRMARGMPSAAREAAAVHRPRAAERGERELARVVPALDRHDPGWPAPC